MSHANATINGQMGCETRGGPVSYYVPDTQGSLIECHDSSGNMVYEAWYWPYGEVRSSSGSKVNPWGYIGLKGYLTDLANLLYVRARYYRPELTRWQTVDPLWPHIKAYEYALAAPSLITDPSGNTPSQAHFGWPCDCNYRTCQSRLDCCLAVNHFWELLVGICGVVFAAAVAACLIVCLVGGVFTMGLACGFCLLSAGVSIGCLITAVAIWAFRNLQCQVAYNDCITPKGATPF